jgi:hypothetical protein
MCQVIDDKEEDCNLLFLPKATARALKAAKWVGAAATALRASASAASL